eukprot:EG_transcript_3923
MFKKPFKAAFQVLKGKDVKALRKAAQEQFPALQDEALLQLLLPAKEDVTLHKVDAHLLYYSVGGVPLFFDISGRLDLFPTVYAMWKAPQLCPALYVGSPVSGFLLGDADLMLPGVLRRGDTPGAFLANDKRCVVVAGNQYPLAVGQMTVSSTEAARQGWKGKGLRVLHRAYDYLWEAGPRTAPEGYQRGQVVPVEVRAPAESPPGDAEGKAESPGDEASPARKGPDGDVSTDPGVPAVAEEGIEGQPTDGQAEGGEADHPPSPPAAAETTPAEADQDKGLGAEAGDGTAVEQESDGSSDGSGSSEDEAGDAAKGLSRKQKKAKKPKKAKGKGKKGGAEDAEAQQASEASAAAVNPAEADRAVLEAFVVAVSRLKDDGLPMLVSDFLEKHLKPGLPEGEVLDWKRTSHKKASNFFKAMAELDLCTTRDKYGLFHLLTVRRDLDVYRETLAAAKERLAAAPRAPPPPAPTKEELRRRFREGLVQITNLYRPTANAKPLFPDDQKDRLYTAAECAAALATYIATQGLDPSQQDRSLFKGRKTRITLDAYLQGTLYKKKADAPDTEELMVLEERFCQNLQQWHSIKHPEGEPFIGKGQLPPIQLVTEMRQGNKVVTRCLHLDDYGFDLPGMQSALQKKFASSVIMPPPTGGSKGAPKYELLAQGHMVDQWADYLLNVLHLPKPLIEVCDKVRRK